MVRKNKMSQQTLSSISDISDLENDDGELKTKNTGHTINQQLHKTLTNEQVTSGSELTHMGGAKIYSISEITKLIKNYLEENEYLNNVWLRGEISNFTLHRSGHMYFDLKDENSIVSSVMFRSANQHLKFKPEHGMKVLGFGSINIYPPHGKYQFIFSELLPDGLGALHLAYIQLKEKLSKEGLFALDHKKPLPRFPKVIGVVTSPTGAAVRDIIRVTTRRFPGINILLAPSKVQGDDATNGLINGIKMLHSVGGVDLIIIGRGGGSLEDLWAFNEEPVARAIYDAEIPIISAVGHETDYTISDFVADERAPTPSAAAELAVPDKDELMQLIKSNIKQIYNILKIGIQNNRIHMNRLLESPAFTRPKDRTNLYRQNLDNLLNILNNNMINFYKLKRSNLEAYLGKFSALNPKAILNRGFSMTLRLPEENLVSSINAIERKDMVKVILKDGEFKCEVTQKVKEKRKIEDNNV
jgi:exodeoxyribonuclease VII large subunit